MTGTVGTAGTQLTFSPPGTGPRGHPCQVREVITGCCRTGTTARGRLAAGPGYLAPGISVPG
ncbi:hypothetical protein [Streptomyces sp. NPDC005795]|uniref:hypothetical protein n=1 Tax=Streptomyces sp. NPDC005795 TaxID=3154677 RepID=UPI0033F70E49